MANASRAPTAWWTARATTLRPLELRARLGPQTGDGGAALGDGTVEAHDRLAIPSQLVIWEHRFVDTPLHAM